MYLIRSKYCTDWKHTWYTMTTYDPTLAPEGEVLACISCGLVEPIREPDNNPKP